MKLQTIISAHVPFSVWQFFQDALNSMLGCYRTVGNLNGGMLLNDTGRRGKSNQGGCSRIRMKQMTLGDKSMRQGEKLREAAEGGDLRRQPRFPNL